MRSATSAKLSQRDSRQNDSEMIGTLLASMLVLAPVRLEPSHDIWVYPHASDPSKDAYLRVWGAEGKSAPANMEEAESVSISILKWNLDKLPTGKKLTSARLELTGAPNPGFTLEQAKEGPIEARLASTAFEEKTWAFENLGKMLPKTGKEAIFGTGAPEAIEAEQPFKVSIDLLKGPLDFRKALAEASGSPTRELALAISSPIDVAALGRAGIYKFFSKDYEKAEARPKLVLEFED